MKESKNTLISVVVPIYNVEKYLSACIESILSQTYKYIEIILVDDGATDTCPQICDQFSLKDSRIKVIHKKNGGLSDARNIGMNLAKGKFITFVDSDDLLDCKFIEDLFNTMIANEADIAFCDYCKIDENCMSKVDNSVGNIIKFSNTECLENLYIPKTHGMEFVAWGKLYKLDLFKKNKIFYPKGKIHEDTFTTYKLCYYANKVVFVDVPRYFYRIRSGSIMSSRFNETRLSKLEAAKEACSFFQEKGESNLLKLSFNDFLHSTLSIYCEMYHGLDRKEFRKLKYELILVFKMTLKEYVNRVNIGKRKTLFYQFFAIFPSVRLAELILK